ncbi:MAG: hypothetical protein WD995_03920 [Gemmatimonadota bacterium]
MEAIRDDERIHAPDLPKSQVVREAIGLYGEQSGRLSEGERRRLLGTFDRVIPRLPRREASAASVEVEEVRQARRRGGRKSRESGER